MDIATKPKDGDIVLEKDGVKIFIDDETNKLLINATMDFDDVKGFVLSGMSKTSCC